MSFMRWLVASEPTLHSAFISFLLLLSLTGSWQRSAWPPEHNVAHQTCFGHPFSKPSYAHNAHEEEYWQSFRVFKKALMGSEIQFIRFIILFSHTDDTIIL